MNVNVGCYLIDKTIPLPHHGSEYSACYDLHASLYPERVKMRCRDNTENNVKLQSDQQGKYLDIRSGCRYLVPTGVIFDIPEGWSMRLQPRSGLSWKAGLIITNGEGIIDADYVNETFVILQNTSDQVIRIRQGDRICQSELVPTVSANFVEIEDAPSQKTTRNGGLGHTGV